MPFEKFSVLEDPKQTLQSWQRKLEYLFNKNLNDDNISSTSLTLGSAQVKASNIDFGTGANQVDASDIPIIDNSSYFSGANIELALAQLGSTILNIPAENVKIVDASSYYSSTSIEWALQEIYSTFSTHRNSTSIHFATSTITTMVPINSSNIVYGATTSFGLLSTTLPGTTELLNAVALNSDLIATNNAINLIRQRLLAIGILTT